MIYSLMRSELGLTWEDILYNISYQNLIMLSKCTPNYSFDKKEKEGLDKYKTTKSIKELMPEVGEKGNVGSLQNLFKILKGGV